MKIKNIILSIVIITVFVGCGGSSGSSSSGSSSSSSSITTPSVSSITPTNNDVNIGVSSNVTVTFDRNMLESTISSQNIFLVKYSDSSNVQATITYDSSTKTATLNPDNALSNNSFYKFTVQNVKDSSSVKMPSPKVLYFMVGDELTFDSKTYKVIKSPITGKNWLDRNMGASGVCTSSTDTNCLGDYYQWGRLRDGHEKIGSVTTLTKASSASSVGHNNFIANTSGGDWVNSGVDDNGSIRHEQWTKTDGSTVCPQYFRIPSQQELVSETSPVTENTAIGQVQIKDASRAYQNFLKFPNQKARLDTNASFGYIGNVPLVWSSDPLKTIFPNYSKYALRMWDYPLVETFAVATRANAGAIRCIKVDF